MICPNQSHIQIGIHPPMGSGRLIKQKWLNQESKPSLEAWEKEEFISLGMDRLNLNHR